MLTAISDTVRPTAATAPMPGLHGREAETSVLSRAPDRAAVIYERLEAARDLARTEATMRQLGIRRGVGERLYIWRRTVQTHVAHIFMKLGVSSRVQLAAEVIRQPSRG